MFQVLIVIGWLLLGLMMAFIATVLILNLCLIELKKEKYTDGDRWKFVSWLTNWAVPLLTFSKTEVDGLEKLDHDHLETGVIYANHYSIFDIFALLKAVKRQHAYIAKKEIGKIFLLNRGMRLMKCGFLDRDDPRAAVKTISEAIQTVKLGILMVIFPEGTRKIHAPLGSFKAGSFKVAVKAKASIVPVTIYNSHLVGKRWPRPTTVQIKVHDPIPYDVYKEMDTPEIAEMVEKIVKQELL
ncbi:MAG: 1-acyl-sn-glycerol-3-phosphate acyltransferase [Defluviitaleaceae bacterium]|nr:1-acyl-sn-glycerol-3-phosphate acyltransferase [Defluviitaleaceae bacterium]